MRTGPPPGSGTLFPFHSWNCWFLKPRWSLYWTLSSQTEHHRKACQVVLTSPCFPSSYLGDLGTMIEQLVWRQISYYVSFCHDQWTISQGISGRRGSKNSILLNLNPWVYTFLTFYVMKWKVCLKHFWCNWNRMVGMGKKNKLVRELNQPLISWNTNALEKICKICLFTLRYLEDIFLKWMQWADYLLQTKKFKPSSKS